jgi:hypothetical protein
MPAKHPEQSAAKTPTAVRSPERKPWKKKTPFEIVMDQTEKLRGQISEREDELKELRKQLQRFEEARKIFESD